MPSETDIIATLQPTIADRSDDMRFTASSPHPESITAAPLAGSPTTHEMHQHHDATDGASSAESSQHYKTDEDMEQTSSNSSNDRGTPRSEATLTSRIRNDVEEDSHDSTHRTDEIVPSMSDDEYSHSPPMGYEFSNKRVRLNFVLEHTCILWHGSESLNVTHVYDLACASISLCSRAKLVPATRGALVC